MLGETLHRIEAKWGGGVSRFVFVFVFSLSVWLAEVESGSGLVH